MSRPMRENEADAWLIRLGGVAIQAPARRIARKAYIIRALSLGRVVSPFRLSYCP